MDINYLLNAPARKQPIYKLERNRCIFEKFLWPKENKVNFEDKIEISFIMVIDGLLSIYIGQHSMQGAKLRPQRASNAVRSI